MTGVTSLNLVFTDDRVHVLAASKGVMTSFVIDLDQGQNQGKQSFEAQEKAPLSTGLIGPEQIVTFVGASNFIISVQDGAISSHRFNADGTMDLAWSAKETANPEQPLAGVAALTTLTLSNLNFVITAGGRDSGDTGPIDGLGLWRPNTSGEPEVLDTAPNLTPDGFDAITAASVSSTKKCLFAAIETGDPETNGIATYEIGDDGSLTLVSHIQVPLTNCQTLTTVTSGNSKWLVASDGGRRG